MSFTSWEFLLLLGAALLLYYLLPGRWQWVVLLAANVVFYLWGGVSLALYLVFATLLTYGAGRWLSRLNGQKGTVDKAVLKKRKRFVAGAALLLNFGMLFAVKYLSGVLYLLGRVLTCRVPAIQLLAPLGISYFVFQSSGYVIDCYRGKYPAQTHLGKYALFTSFFPQMAQGPISRYHQLGEQLSCRHVLDWENLRQGAEWMLWGFFKKLVIADRAGVLVETVFSSYENYSGSIIVLGVAFYCVQLYCDFSGGIDVARGAAKLFGIDLAENFRRPIFAVSVTDYWRRWHITLGSWMRDYVFYPLSLSKPFARLGRWSRAHLKGLAGKILPTSLATFIVYFIIGIWHGSNPKYIVFGLYNGVIITASLLLEPAFQSACDRLHIQREGWPWRIFRMLRTGSIVFFGRYLTRAEILTAAGEMLRSTVTQFHFADLINGTELQLGISKLDYLVVFFGVLVLLLLEFCQELGADLPRRLQQKSGPVQYLALLATVTVVLVLGVWIKGEITTGFIYMQF